MTNLLKKRNLTTRQHLFRFLHPEHNSCTLKSARRCPFTSSGIFCLNLESLILQANSKHPFLQRKKTIVKILYFVFFFCAWSHCHDSRLEPSGKTVCAFYPQNSQCTENRSPFSERKINRRWRFFIAFFRAIIPTRRAET